MAKHRREEGEPRSPFIMESVQSPNYQARHLPFDEDGKEDDICFNLIQNSYSNWREPVE